MQSVTIEAANGEHEFACTQLQNTLMGRGDIIKRNEFRSINKKSRDVWNAIPVVSLDHQEIPVTSPDE